jgi:dUTP pyrophosphatase
MMMQIKIKYKSPNTPRLKFIDGNKSNWIDLCADENVTMKAGQHYLIPLGVAMQLPEGYEANIVPRGSTFKNFKVIQTNHYGVVDNSFCGNDDWWMFSAYALEDTVIEKGSRICQFRINKIQPKFEFIEVEKLENKSRGMFGSTGIK